MRLLNKKKLEKFKRKNRGNKALSNSIDQLVKDFENNNWKSQVELVFTRADADCVHSDGFYIFNLSIHRTMVLVEFDELEATVVWVGNHQEYEAIFQNNKNSIRHWLRSNGWI